MRIIYEDENFRKEKEAAEETKKDFTDISSMSDEYKKNLEQENREGKPYRPAATLRSSEPIPNEAKQAPAVQEEANTQPYPVQTAYMYPQVQYPQGYPVQYVQYPQGYPVYPYPQQYQQAGYPNPPQYPQNVVQYPQNVVQHPQNVNQNLQQTQAGTRVIYQSPDFDIAETERSGAPQYTPQVRSSGSFTHEDVSPAVSPAANPIKRAVSDEGRFKVDDVEMSVFELNSMTHRHYVKTRSFKNPDENIGTIEVEECQHGEIFPEEKGSFGNEPSYSEEREAEKKAAEKKKKKKRKRREIIRKTVLVVSLIAMAVSLFFLYNEYRLSKENEESIQKAQDLIIDDSFLTAVNSGNNNQTDDSDNSEDESSDSPTLAPQVQQTLEEKWEEVRKEFPDVDFPSGLQIKYARLYGTNEEFVGYLSAAGIDMNLPIVQTDNDEYYLKKSFFGESTKYGCPFVTHLNTIPEDRNGLDMNTVIFGHHMNDGSVFGILDEYKSIEGFKAAPVITFNTMYNDYEWKVIAAFVTNAYEEDDNGYVFKYYFTNLSNEERFSAYLNALSERSLYYTGVDVLPTDKILTLSTCSHEFENARFVVVARLVRQGESSQVDVSKAVENDNPRYPQAYYDEKKLDNPYKDAYRWEVE